MMNEKERGKLEVALDNEIEALTVETLSEAIPHYSSEDSDEFVAGSEAYLVGYLSGMLDTIRASDENDSDPEEMRTIVGMVERRGNEIQFILEGGK